MACAEKTLIHAGLLDTMVTQSYLDSLIETCPQITRNVVFRKEPRVRIPNSPPMKLPNTYYMCWGFFVYNIKIRVAASQTLHF